MFYESSDTVHQCPLTSRSLCQSTTSMTSSAAEWVNQSLSFGAERWWRELQHKESGGTTFQFGYYVQTRWTAVGQENKSHDARRPPDTRARYGYYRGWDVLLSNTEDKLNHLLVTRLKDFFRLNLLTWNSYKCQLLPCYKDLFFPFLLHRRLLNTHTQTQTWSINNTLTHGGDESCT